MNASIAHWVTAGAQKIQAFRTISHLKWLIRKAALKGYFKVGIYTQEEAEDTAIVQWLEQNGYKYSKDDRHYVIEW